MARDISDVVPDYIAQLIYAKWGDMKSFSVAIGLPYTSVYSVLVRRGRRAIDTLFCLAKPLSITPDELAGVLLIEDLEVRKAVIADYLKGKSLNQWAREVSMDSGTLCKIVNNLEQTQIRNVVTIAIGLELSITKLSEIYDHCQKAS